MTRDPDLPDFEHPPVVEVALGVQFQPLLGLGSRHLGLLYEKWRQNFPIWEDQPPLQPVKEWFGVAGQQAINVRLDLRTVPPLRRAFFFDPDRTELRQVQADRFVRNWRRSESPYPRYDDSDTDGSKRGLRSRFHADLKEFVSFVREHDLGEFVPNQCEVTYVNHVPTSGNRAAAADLSELLGAWRGAFSDEFLDVPESASAHFVMTDNNDNRVGRLHLDAAPARDQTSGEDVTRLTLTARGAPLGEGIDGVLGFLDLGRRYIVKGFASVTTPEMHKKWGRKNGR